MLLSCIMQIFLLFFGVTAVWSFLWRRIYTVVYLPANLKLLSIKDEITLREGACHSADILDAISVLLATFICLNKFILELD